MSMQLRIEHTTTYTYGGPAAASYNQARLTPLTSTDQIVAHSRVEISPKPWTYEYRDYFGTAVTAFEVVDPHDAMTVRATATVHVDRAAPPPATLEWADLRERDVNDRWTEYLVRPELVEPTPDLAQRVKQIGADWERPGEAALDVCALVHDEIEFVPGTTTSRSSAATVWQQRSGVCQDMAHVALGGLRSLGIPARYVSGYVHPDADPVVGATVPGSSHAWVEWWDGAWRGYDVATAQDLDDRYVTLATGRDYDDVKPLAGIYSGPETTALSVTVEITRLS